MHERDYLFNPAVAAVPVAETDKLYFVRRIYCVGRNFPSHVREMGGDERETPFFFQKPSDAIVLSGSTVPYPPLTNDFQHEIELVLAIGREGSNISVAGARDHVFALAVGIDLTRRDAQIAARKAGRPWEIGKSFDHSAPVSDLRPLGCLSLPIAGEISLSVNGNVRQKGDLSEMIWNAAEIVSQLSQQYRLFPGDLIFTGTPAGVGPLQPGDEVLGGIEQVGEVRIVIGPAAY